MTHSMQRKLWLVVLMCGWMPTLSAATQCAARPAARHAIQQLQRTMATGRFVAYQPTSQQVINGQLTRVDISSIEQDLRALRPRFDGLITYSSNQGADRIADVAARLGYRSMIMGVWNVNDAQEVAAAVAAAQRQPKLVIGISLGNERVYARQISSQALALALNSVRKSAPQLAITTTEPFHILLEHDAMPLLAASDFMLVNVHPVFESWFRAAPDANAAEFVTRVVDKLQDVACGPILVKETGVPTAPADKGFTVARQLGFYQALAQRFVPTNNQAFVYFSAFDAPWRVNDVSPVPGVHPEEAYWGLFDEHRQPKPVVQSIPLLSQ
jgi:exo-beta-1,3-glucanase (GH17 family)